MGASSSLASPLTLDSDAAHLAAASEYAGKPAIVTKIIQEHDIDVATALELDDEDLLEICAKKLDRKRLKGALNQLRLLIETSSKATDGVRKTESSATEHAVQAHRNRAFIPVPTGYEYFGFLTHTWTSDGLGRNNHERVGRIYEALKNRGLVNWFDGEKMQDDVVQQMIDGIDSSAVIVVFVTDAYIKKVGSKNPADNCLKEFMYASRKKTAARMLAVPMEPSCLNPSAWEGPVGMELGGMLYKANFADDTSDFEFEKNVEILFDEILRKAGVTKLPPNFEEARIERHDKFLKMGGDSGATAVVSTASESKLSTDNSSKPSRRSSTPPHSYSTKVEHVSEVSTEIGSIGASASVAAASASRSSSQHLHREPTTSAPSIPISAPSSRPAPAPPIAEALPLSASSSDANRWMCLAANGVAYRNSMDMSDQYLAVERAHHNQEINALRERMGSDGNWLKIDLGRHGPKYLPISEGGEVLFLPVARPIATHSSNTTPPAAAEIPPSIVPTEQCLSWRCVDTAGVAYRNSTTMDDRYTRIRGPDHGDVTSVSEVRVVNGVAWLVVSVSGHGVKYLPTVKAGKDLFEQVAHDSNASTTQATSWRCVDTAGVAYRNSTTMGDRYTRIRGPDHGDVITPLQARIGSRQNWLKILVPGHGEKYLPIEKEGKTLFTCQ